VRDWLKNTSGSFGDGASCLPVALFRRLKDSSIFSIARATRCESSGVTLFLMVIVITRMKIDKNKKGVNRFFQKSFPDFLKFRRLQDSINLLTNK
jgi:hypothetical protein